MENVKGGTLNTDEEIEQFAEEIVNNYLSDSQNTHPEPYTPYLSKVQNQAIYMIHEKLAQELTNELTRYLKVSFNLNMRAVEEFTYNQFIDSIQNPSIITTLNLEGLKAEGVLQFGPHIGMAIEDLMDGKQLNILSRPIKLTPHSLQMNSNVVKQFILEPLNNAWKEIVELKPFLEKIETDPHQVCIVPKEERIILAMLYLVISDPKDKTRSLESTMELGIPYSALKGVLAGVN